MPRTLVIILLSSLCLAACKTSTVHKNVWFEDDGRVMRKEAPPGSTLPAARESSYASVRFGVRASFETDALGETTMMVAMKDQPAAINPEPLDLDVALRVDGEAGTWIKGILGRTYKPLNVPKGTGSSIRLHELDWTQETRTSSTYNRETGDPALPHIKADVYVEFWFVGREYVDGDDWYYIIQYRSRIESEHADWEVSDSEFEFEARGGMKITLPLFPRAE
jgi:hypothetical protein